MGFKLADLFVQITGNAAPLHATLGAVKGVLLGVDRGVGRLAGGLAGALGAVGTRANNALGVAAVAGAAALGVGIYKAISGASDLNETLSKVGEVFGPAAGVVTGFADEMAKAFGAPKREMLDAASMFGLIGEGMGQSKERAAGFSVSMAKLAADASSFYNVPLPEALEKIRAGLTGESEPLKAFGVIMDENAVKAQAAALGFKAVGGELSNEAKLAARQAIITRGLSAATGDLERTQGGAANQARKFWGTLENLGDTIGTALMPAFTAFLGLANTVLGDLSAGFEKNQGAVAGFVAGVVSGFETAGAVYRNFGDVLGLVGVDIAEGWLNIGERTKWLWDNAAEFLGWFADEWTTIIPDALNAVLTALTNFGTNFAEFFSKLYEYAKNGFKGPLEIHLKPLLDGFEAQTTAPKFSEFKATSLDDDRAKLTDAITAREAKRLADQKKVEDGAKTARGADAAPGAAKKEKAEKATFSDAAGFAKKLQEGAFGKDVAKEQLGALRQIDGHMQKLVGIAQKPKPPVIGVAAP